VGEKLLFAEVLFAAAAGVVELDAVVVADGGEVAGVEEGARVGELGALLAVFEAAAGVGDVEGHIGGFAGGERRVELIDGVDAVGALGDGGRGDRS
jgi:hypothetical protein